MKFRTCLGITFVMFVAVYLCSIDFGSLIKADDPGVDAIAARRNTAPIGQPPVQRAIPVYHIPKPQGQGTRPKESPPVPIRHEPVATPQPTPPPTVIPVTRSRIKLAETRIKILWPANLQASHLDDLFRREGCRVAVVKLDGILVVDAFLSDNTGELYRVDRGETGNHQVDEFLADYPVEKYFWVRCEELSDALVREGQQVLRARELKTEEYAIYVILGRELSLMIQSRLEHYAKQHGIDTERPLQGEVALRATPDGWQAEVQELKARPNQRQT